VGAQPSGNHFHASKLRFTTQYSSLNTWNYSEYLSAVGKDWKEKVKKKDPKIAFLTGIFSELPQ